MTLTLDKIAALAVASPTRYMGKDNAIREVVKSTRDMHRAEAIQAARDAAERFADYTPAQHARISALRNVHWPRTRAIRDALSQCDALITRHNDKHDDYSLSENDYADVIIRGCRLVTLLSRAYAASAAIGRFPVSRADMRTDKRTRFIGSAAARHFTFAGGRDWGSAEFDPADIVQGAFIRALDNGDSVHGVPTFGSMFRWIQVERAHLTRMNDAEYAARKRAALGWTSLASQHELDTMYPEDKHSLRLLGTRNYATLNDHRAALAIAHRDAEMENIDDAVTRDARNDELTSASENEFHAVVARVLMAGATLQEIADALGQRVETVTRDVMASKLKTLRPLTTGIDHSERSIDLHNAAEREREIDQAEAAHAARLREIEVIRATVAYASAKVA